jgi:hypothetical protein
MKIKTTQTNVIESEISDQEVKRICLSYIYDKLSWGEGFYLKDGNVCCEEICHSSHCFSVTKIIRKATEEDFLTERFMCILK